MKILIAFLLPVVLFSCKPSGNKIDQLKVGKIKSVVILGNSIVRHPPLSSIGWNNDWGMAATSIDSDFVHILIRDFKAKDSTVLVRFMNIADFEYGFENYNYSKFDSLKNPDMLIIRLGENVNDSTVIAKHFTEYYQQIIDRIDPKGNSLKIIVDGFWKPKTSKELKALAQDKGYAFISTANIDKPENRASQFSNPLVAGHPNNKGMKLIAERIWAYTALYFK